MLDAWFLLTQYHDYYIILSSYLRPIVPFLRLRESACTAMPLLVVSTHHSDRWHSSYDPVTGDRIYIFSIIIPIIRKENKHIRVVPKGVARAMSDVSTVQIKADRAQLTRYTCKPHHRPYLDSRVLHDKPHIYKSTKYVNEGVKFFVLSPSGRYTRRKIKPLRKNLEVSSTKWL